MKLNKLFILFLLAVFLATMPSIAKTKSSYGSMMPEIEVLDYQFMHKLSTLLKSTNPNITDSTNNFIFKKNGVFELDIKDLKHQSSKQEIDFVPNGSYFIQVAYRDWYLVDNHLDYNLFTVDEIRFLTLNQQLKTYFDSCKRNKVAVLFDYCSAFAWCYFWYFKVENGNVLHAYFYYEKNDYDLMNNPVYDLLNNKIMRYYDLLSIIKSF